MAGNLDCSPSGIKSGYISFNGTYNPNTTNKIKSIAPAEGKDCDADVEYIWLKSLVNVPNTTGNPYWSVVSGSQNRVELIVPFIVQTTYFIRCARLKGCQKYWGETNIVQVPVDLCKADFIHGGSIAFQGTYNPNTTNVVQSVQPATSDFGAGMNIEYIWLKSAVNVPNTVGNPYWSKVQGSNNQVSLTLGQLTATTYFIRCARVAGCDKYWGETNIVQVPVDVCKADFIHGGSIAFQGTYNPNTTNVVQSVQPATSDFGAGMNIEYVWLKSAVNVPNTVGNPHWSMVQGSNNQLSLTLGELTATTYFIRCARVEGCEMYWGETNIVQVPVDVCKADFIHGGSIAFEGTYNPNTTNVVQNVQPATSDFGDGLNLEYIWLKSAVNVPNTVGNPYWSVVQGSNNQLSLTLGELTATTYFIRCARVTGCEMYWGETNIVQVPVDVCNASFIHGGSIAFQGTYNPNTTNVVQNVQPATSDFGAMNMEYIWLKSAVNVPNTVGNPYWSVVQGSNNQLSLTLGQLTATTYFIRCARVEGCEMYWGETNIAEVTVDPCIEGSIAGGSIGFNGPYDPVGPNTITNVASASGPFAGLGFEYVWLQSEVNVPNIVGNPYWSVVPGSNNQLELEVGELTHTMYFIRCARYVGCNKYWGETNIVGVEGFEIPTATITGGGAVCGPNGTANINIYLTGVNPFNITYSNGTTNSTVVVDGTSYSFAGSAGTYSLVSVTDANYQATLEGQAIVTAYAIPTASILGGGMICSDEQTTNLTINLTGVAPWTIHYSVDGEAMEVETSNATYTLAASSGVYQLISIQDAHCSGEANGTAQVSLFEKPTASISGGGSICENEKVDLTVNLTGSAPWTIVYSVDGQNTEVVSNNNQLTLQAGAGQYQLISVNDSHCSGTVSGNAQVTLTPAFNGSIDLKSSYCFGEEIEVKMNNGGTNTISWTTSGGGQLTIVNNTTVQYQPLSSETSVTFTAQVTTSCGIVERSANTTIVPAVNTAFSPSEPVENYITNVNYSFIPSFDGGDNYTWHVNEESSNGEVLDSKFEISGEYTISLTVEVGGCSSSESMGITVNGNQSLFVPNVFNPYSPNPENNVVKVYAEGVQENSFLFRIYNRWGTLVYETRNFDQARNSGWNGYFNGELQALGSYTYTVTGFFADGQSFEKTGIVSIAR
ncbi:MAG: gliding motility-associated C-terminal domain-containing protein [Cyclobacteriaceae bacterium]|nr:gliding motility-associated C-terminal domain-containing protein [Cyclobacteriaceae bacterium]